MCPVGVYIPGVRGEVGALVDGTPEANKHYIIMMQEYMYYSIFPIVQHAQHVYGYNVGNATRAICHLSTRLTSVTLQTKGGVMPSAL